MKIIKATIYIVSFVALFLAALQTNAAEQCRSELGGYCASLAATALAQGIKGLEFLGPTSANPGELLIRIYVFALGLVVLASFVGLVLAGGAYLLARDSEKWTSMARTWAGNAIFGLVLALLSYLVLFTINPQLIQGLNLNPRDITNVGPYVGIIDGENIGIVSKGSIDSSSSAVNECVAKGGKIDSIGRTTVCVTKDATQRQKLEFKPCVINIFNPCKTDGALCKEAGGDVVTLGGSTYCTKPFKNQAQSPQSPQSCESTETEICVIIGGSCRCSPKS